MGYAVTSLLAECLESFVTTNRWTWNRSALARWPCESRKPRTLRTAAATLHHGHQQRYHRPTAKMFDWAMITFCNLLSRSGASVNIIIGVIIEHRTSAKNTKTTTWLVWLRGTVVQTLGFDRRTFPVPCSTCSWRVTTYVGKTSATGQPTGPTQPFILSGSINWAMSYFIGCVPVPPSECSRG